MKKIIILLLSVFFLLLSNKVYASIYYINENGVKFTKEQYEFISNLYYEGYQDLIKQNELDKMNNMDLFNQDIVSVDNEYVDYICTPYLLNNESITESGVKITISKTCSSKCLVVLKASWQLIPTINSYDVIGFRVEDVEIDEINKSTITGLNYTKVYQKSDSLIFSNGFGYSIKLGNVANMVITTSMYTNNSGTIYGSYQHTNYNISLATSKLYTISSIGYGKVFNFYGDALFKYNNLSGVSLSL